MMFFKTLTLSAFLAVAVRCQQEAEWAGLVLTRNAEPDKPIPLRTVDIDLDIRGWAVGCKATLTYRLGDDEAPSNDVEFIFPTDTEAAVYHLEIQQGDRRLYGKIMEKDEAHSTYNSALQNGQQAALLESHGSSADVYRLALGRVGPGEEVKVIVGYAQPIDRDPQNGTLHYILPMVFNPRAVSNETLSDPLKAKSRLRADSIWVSVQPQRLNYDISIRGKVDMGQADVNLVAIEAMHSADEMSVSLRTEQVGVFDLTNFRNDHDFGIRIKVSDPLEAGLFVEAGLPRTEANSFNEAIVAGVWLDHKMAQVVTNRTDFRDEYWFVIDQSRSMLDRLSGRSISKFEQARSAMNLFLRALPENAYFNILGFGGLGCPADQMASYDNLLPPDEKERYCDRPADQRKGYVNLFDEPLEVSEDSFTVALEYVQNVRADVWGSSLILPALQHIYSQTAQVEPPNRRYIFLITDGAVDNYDAIMALARRNKQTARVFSVGIGDGVSTMLKRIALQTGGAFEAVRDGANDRLQEKVARLMSYAQGNSVDDLKITWNIDEPGTLTRTIPGPNLTSTSALYGRETLQFAVLNRENDADSFIGTVTIQGSSDGLQIADSLVLNVAASRLAAPLDVLPLHRLAAKQRLNDLVDLYRDNEDEATKDLAVRFSIESGVVCEFTALVAVDDNTGEVKVINEAPKKKAPPAGMFAGLIAPRIGGIGSMLDPMMPAAQTARRPATINQLESLMALQRFNGSWSLTAQLVRLVASPNATNTTRLAALIRQSVLASAGTGLRLPVEASGHRDDAIATLAGLTVMRVTFSHRALETQFSDSKAVDYLRKVAGNPTDQGLERIVNAISNRLAL